MLRKRQLTITFFLLISTGVSILRAGSPIIGGYLLPAPEEVLASLTIEETQKPVVGGIKLTYNGFSDFTNRDGYFSFPKHHPEQELRIIVCTDTTYDLLKNTVSKVKTQSDSPDIAVYKIIKQKDTAQPQQKPAVTTPTNEQSTDASWYYKSIFLGNTAPKNGIYSTDLIIHCEPSSIYIKSGKEDAQTGTPDDVVFYDGTDENSHFIIPDECMYLLKTPPAPELDQEDLMTESVDAEKESDTVASKSTETDSMGNALPGVIRSAMSDAQQ